MDAKITKQRLSRLLSYDWLKIIGVALAGIVVWSLVFTVTATRITPAQQFMVFNHYANVPLDYSSFYDSYDTAIERNVFSYEVLETEVLDLTTAKEEHNSMFNTRLPTGQGDLMFVPNIPDADRVVRTINEAGEEVTTYTHTYVETFYADYPNYTLDWDTFIAGGKAYLTTYFGEDYANGELNKAKAEEAFRARIKQNKDKRFKREKQIVAGLEAEYERLEKYRDAFVTFEGYLAEGVVRLEEVFMKDANGNIIINEETNEPLSKGHFALNLSPDDRNPKLTNTVYYSVKAEDGSDVSSSKNMCVILFSVPDMDNDFLYESLLYINTVIASSLPTQTA